MEGCANGAEQRDCRGATLMHEGRGTEDYDDRGDTTVQNGSITQGSGGVALAFTFGGVSVS